MFARHVLGACLSVQIVACAGPSTEIPGVGSGEVIAEQERQLAFQLQAYVAQNARLQQVFHRIAVANVEFCGASVAPRLGFVAVTPQELPERYRNIGRAALSLDDARPTVIAVAAGGPASQAGMVVGDVLVALDGETIPTDKQARDWINDVLGTRTRQRVRIDLLRQGKPHVIAPTSVSACAHPISLAVDSDLNAFTDGRQIIVHTGLLRVAQSDAELATVVGHELAHITMSHLEKMKGNQVAGAFGGLLVDVALAAAGVNTQGAFTRGFGNVGGRAYATDFEREADYVGAYFVARAGFDPTEAEKFWRTLAQESPKQIFFAGLHPTSPERFLLIQRTNDEVAQKRRANLPLRPEMKATQLITPAVAVDRAASD
jgi:beta-barrel assembly-enhancing protease